MKIRTGFVSNSSSSSYVVFIPNDFNLDYDNLDLPDYTEEDKIDMDVLKDMVSRLQRGSGICQQDGYAEYETVLQEIENRKLVVLEISGGPDDGSMEPISKEKITEIYNKFIGGTK